MLIEGSKSERTNYTVREYLWLFPLLYAGGGFRYIFITPTSCSRSRSVSLYLRVLGSGGRLSAKWHHVISKAPSAKYRQNPASDHAGNLGVSAQLRIPKIQAQIAPSSGRLVVLWSSLQILQRHAG